MECLDSVRFSGQMGSGYQHFHAVIFDGYMGKHKASTDSARSNNSFPNILNIQHSGKAHLSDTLFRPFSNNFDLHLFFRRDIENSE